MIKDNFKNAEEKLFWVNLLPIAAAVCDLDSFEIITCNDLFCDLALLDKDKTYKITDLLDVEKDCYLVNNGIVKLTTTLGERKTLIMDSSSAEIGGKNYLLCTFIDVFMINNKGLRLSIDMSDSDKTDPMTGIYNKEYGYILLNEVIKQSGDDISTICHLDINDLTKVNKNYGQKTGDEYIMSVVSVLKTATRQSDIFARIGGDEFLLIFPKCRYEIVETIMDTVINKLELINKTSDNEYETSISFGIVELLPGKFEDADKAVAAAVSIMQVMKKEYYER